MTLKEMRKRLKELKATLKTLDPNDTRRWEIESEIAELEEEIRNMTNTL